jgi:hypothetical protein
VFNSVPDFEQLLDDCPADQSIVLKLLQNLFLRPRRWKLVKVISRLDGLQAVVDCALKRSDAINSVEF